MDKKTKVFFAVFSLLIVGSITVTFWKMVVKRDYIIKAQVECDPTVENCFVHVCDPDPDVDGPEACKGNPTDDTWYTKNISRKAYNIPLCDPNTDENCTALVCSEGEADCSYELCDDSNVPEGDSCNDPAQYVIDNPATDEASVACDPAMDDTCPMDSSDGTGAESETADPAASAAE